jgi:hypothetical protein
MTFVDVFSISANTEKEEPAAMTVFFRLTESWTLATAVPQLR